MKLILIILFCSVWIIEGKEKVEKTEHNDKIAVSKMFPAHDRVVKRGKGNIKAIYSVYLLTYLCTYEKHITEKCRCGEAILGAVQKSRKTSRKKCGLESSQFDPICVHRLVNGYEPNHR